MKVLWFSITPSRLRGNKYNGGGWIESLERIVGACSDIELGIAFIGDSKQIKTSLNGVTYYSISLNRSFISKNFIDKFTYKYVDSICIKKSLQIIEDFKPDVIHVFGSENCFGLLYNYIKIPLVIHMQGSWPSYREAAIYGGFSFFARWKFHKFSLSFPIGEFMRKNLSKMRAKREIEVLRTNVNFMYRTRWDKSIVKLFSPVANLYFCNEALRDAFALSPATWNINTVESKKRIVTVSAPTTLKGFDLILKTCSVLKKYASFEFEWNIVGCTNEFMRFIEIGTGISHKDVSVVPKGNLKADEIIKELLDSDIYVHTANIDNSPNSLCEAQFLGLPIITTNVGGIPSLFHKNYDNDLFVPLNDPYYLASKLVETLNSQEKLKCLSILNRSIARIRHSDKNIEQELLSVYRNLLK